MKRVKCITINTDASFSHQEKVGGYAFYIICDLFKIQKSGAFKSSMTNPHHAELMAIGNAIATLLAQDLPSTSLIVVNTDSLAAINSMTTRINTALDKKVFSLKKKLAKRTGAKIEFRHVKAHNGKQDARSWVNDWCDSSAKYWMRRKVMEIKAKREILFV